MSECVVIIPAYNECETIFKVVSSIKSHATVVVVDDASDDNTADLAKKAGAKVIKSSTNLGYHHALGLGFIEANKLGAKKVVTFDADGEHDSKLIKVFFNMLDKVPLVLGYREKTQRISEAIIGWLVFKIWGARDIFCGVRGYKMDMYLYSDGWGKLDTSGVYLAMYGLRKKLQFKQILVIGEKRKDTPRFGGLVRGNMKLIIAFFRLVRLK